MTQGPLMGDEELAIALGVIDKGFFELRPDAYVEIINALRAKLNAAYTAGLAAQREDSVLQPEAEASRHGLPATSESAALHKDTGGTTAVINTHDFIERIEREPENDKASLMSAFDEIVSGPIDGVHIERMSDNLYWMALLKGDVRQIVVIHAVNPNAKIVARTEAE